MARLPSNMKHDFSRVPQANIGRSSFDRSMTHKTTFNSGYLVPIFVDEAVPGDTFNVRLHGFARLATPLHPFMDNLYFNTFWFAVPLRLLWTNWVRLMGERDNPGDSVDFLVPQVASGATGFAEMSIFDYMGLPVGEPNLSVSAFWPRAYNLIYNEWFRDQNLQDAAIKHTGDGPDPLADFPLRRRGKRHDYFTSSLPWPQKGEAVDIPLAGTAPIRGLGTSPVPPIVGPVSVWETDRYTTTYDFYQNSADVPVPTLGVETDSAGNPQVYANLAGASGATINQLRQAFALQQLLERDARGGTRYTEIIRSHFSVISPDARLQRPEYLGGGESIVNLHTVPQTSAAGDYAATPQANLAAYGTASIAGHGFTSSFTEHCVIVGLLSVRADLNYQQGVNRMWSRRTKYDFFWPELAHIGEQAVLNREIFFSDADGLNDEVWGYQERFGEMRYKPSLVTGQMRSSSSLPLDTWHLAQDFVARPQLDAAFIEENPPVARVIAVPTEPHFIFDSYIKARCARPMPVYGIPGMTRL